MPRSEAPRHFRCTATSATARVYRGTSKIAGSMWALLGAADLAIHGRPTDYLAELAAVPASDLCRSPSHEWPQQWKKMATVNRNPSAPLIRPSRHLGELNAPPEKQEYYF